MNGCGVAIFVKTPALSPVKSRLWPGIGRRCAEALYLLSAEAVASVAQQVQGVQPYWAVAEAAALHSNAWLDLPHLAQGEGALGERMAQVYRQLRQRHHAALLIGADAPQLTTALLHKAAEWLGARESRLVLGRAEDGGFWLFGGNVPLPAHHWQDVTYSIADTADMFSAQMRRHGQWLELEALRDIDVADDIPRVQSSLAAIQAPTPAQSRLLQWLPGIALPGHCA